MVFGKWTATCKRMNLGPYHIPYTKINSEWSKNLNTRPGTIELLEENREDKLSDTGVGNVFFFFFFFDLTIKGEATKEKKKEIKQKQTREPKSFSSPGYVNS